MNYANENIDIINAAVDWAQTIPGDINITQHPEFARYFGGMNEAEFSVALNELDRRAEAAASEAKELIDCVRARSNEGIT